MINSSIIAKATFHGLDLCTAICFVNTDYLLIQLQT